MKIVIDFVDGVPQNTAAQEYIKSAAAVAAQSPAAVANRRAWNESLSALIPEKKWIAVGHTLAWLAERGQGRVP